MSSGERKYFSILMLNIFSAWVSPLPFSVLRPVLPSLSWSPEGILPLVVSWEDPSSSRQSLQDASSSSGCSTSQSPPWRPTVSSILDSKKFESKKKFSNLHTAYNYNIATTTNSIYRKIFTTIKQASIPDTSL